MVKKTLLSMAIAATVVGLAGCNVSSTDKYDDSVNLKPSTAGNKGTTPAVVTPLFSAGSQNLPLFNDLIFADAAKTDGTASADDLQPPVTTALNGIDGVAVAAPIDIEFNSTLDAATLNKPFSVLLLKLRNAEDDANIDALDLKSIAANSPVENGNPNVFDGVDQPELGKDYTVSILDLDGGDTPTLRINLLKPLDPRTKYIVALTDYIESRGEAVGPSAEYNLLRGNLELPSEALQPVREAVQGWENIAKGYLLGAVAKFTADSKAAAEADMPEAAAQAAGAAKLAAGANVILSYAFTTGGTTSGLKMAAAPEMYVRALAEKPDTAEKLFLGAQVGGYYQAQSIAKPTEEDKAAAEAYAKTQWMSAVVGPVLQAKPELAFADQAAPTDDELETLRASVAYQGAIIAAAKDPLVIGGVTATLSTPKAQDYSAIPSVALTPAEALAGTPLEVDGVTEYVQGALTLPVGIGAPKLTNAQALASGDPVLIENAVKLSMASDGVWSADPALNPPMDNKKFDPTTGRLVAAAVDAETGEITDGMTNVTYRYPLVNLDKTENVPVLVTLPGDYSGLGKTDCTGLPSYPVIVFLHGITSDRTSSIIAAQSAAMNGCYATVAMDLPLHGVAPVGSDRNNDPILNSAMAFNVEQNSGDPTKTPYAYVNENVSKLEIHERHYNIGTHPVTNARMDMKFGADLETSLGKSGDNFINIANMGRLRDNMRQAVLDNIHLLASLENIATAHNVNFDTSKVYVAGHSLGAILATTLTTVVNDSTVQALNGNLPKIQAALLANPGASLPKMLENSPGFAPTILGGLDLAQDSSSLQKYEAILQTALNSVDPVGFAAELAAQDTPVLLYNAVGGGDCPNFVPLDKDGNPTATKADMVSANCSTASGSNERLPSGIALAFQGKYPADHVVPNDSYFADASTNPFARIMLGLNYKLDGVETQVKEVPSAYAPLVGTNPLSKLAGLTVWDGSQTGVSKTEIQFDKATHSTFSAADDADAFGAMMTQMLTFFTTNGTALNPGADSGVKKATAE